jgi:hypothetical protein
MAVSNLPIYPQVIKDYAIQILPATLSNPVTICTAGANGSKIDSLIVSNTDTSSRDIQVFKTIGGVDYLLFTFLLPASSANNDNTPPIDLLSLIPGLQTDSNGNKDLFLASGTTLRVKSLSTVSSTKALNFIGSGGDF